MCYVSSSSGLEPVRLNWREGDDLKRFVCALWCWLLGLLFAASLMFVLSRNYCQRGLD